MRKRHFNKQAFVRTVHIHNLCINDNCQHYHTSMQSSISIIDLQQVNYEYEQHKAEVEKSENSENVEA